MVSFVLLQVALVFPNSDPVMFMVAFYGCLLAELVPVPIEVPLTRKVASLGWAFWNRCTVGRAWLLFGSGVSWCGPCFGEGSHRRAGQTSA